ncbi:MAG TPA: hypothetical protein VF771_03290 [Longimicrobiaceae bacterium]
MAGAVEVRAALIRRNRHSRQGAILTRLDDFLLKHRSLVRKLLLAAAVALPALALVAALLVRLRIVDLGARSGAAVTFLVFYVAPLFIAAPLWLRERVDVVGRARVLDLAVVALAFARFVGGGILPFSGHMLFLTYSLLARPISFRYRLLAVALLIETTVFKLWIWRDPRSWGLGLALGLAAAVAWWLVRKPVLPMNPQADEVKSAAYLTWAEWGPDARIPRDERLASLYPAVSAGERQAWQQEFARVGRFIDRVAQAGAEKTFSRERFTASIRQAC